MLDAAAGTFDGQDPKYTFMPDFSGFIWGFPKIRGTILGGPYNEDSSILGSILGSPYFGKLPYTYRAMQIVSINLRTLE